MIELLAFARIYAHLAWPVLRVYILGDLVERTASLCKTPSFFKVLSRTSVQSLS